MKLTRPTSDHPGFPVKSSEEGIGMTVEPWHERAARAHAIQESAAKVTAELDALDQPAVDEWLAALDRRAMVGTRHHTVPRFLLERWADPKGKVLVHRRIEQVIKPTNIRDLAIRNFYTMVNLEGRPDSTMESLLGQVEGDGANALKKLLDPYAPVELLPIEDLCAIAMLAAFQAVRGARVRKEMEMQAEWMTKTLASHQVSDEQLRRVGIRMHPNEHIGMMGRLANDVFPLMMSRPLVLVTLDRRRLFIGDEAIVVNGGPDADAHIADCLLTEDEVSARIRRRRRKDRRNRKAGGRIAHFTSTRPRGLGTALELVMPISPRSALVWGPLQEEVCDRGPLREVLDRTESERFADMLNEATCDQALDWVVGPHDDADFPTRAFPPPGPLMRVCDGDNAAAFALNEKPEQFRPSRLWFPGDKAS